MSIELAAFIACERLDIKTASERDPQSLRAEFIKGLFFIPLSDSDINLILLFHKFRASLRRARKKRPDNLSSAIAGCREGNLDEATWEARMYGHAGKHVVDAVRTALRDVPMDEDGTSDLKREAVVLKHGGRQAVTAFHVVHDLMKAGDVSGAEAQISEYGGTQALAACAVAAADDPKVTASLENLSDGCMKSLAAFISFNPFHMDLAHFVNTIFRTKPQTQTRRNRIGRVPRKSVAGRTTGRNRRDTMKSAHVSGDGQPCESIVFSSSAKRGHYDYSQAEVPGAGHAITAMSSRASNALLSSQGCTTMSMLDKGAETFQPLPNKDLLDCEQNSLLEPAYDGLLDDKDLSQLLVHDYHSLPDQL